MELTTMRRLLVTAALSAGCVSALAAGARVQVTNALVRATTEGQGTGIAFVDLRAVRHARLVGASSPVCGEIVLHEMAHEQRGDVTNISMQPVDSVDLPTGRRVSLKPGDRHLMLTHLGNQLVAGASVPITLNFVDAAGRPFSQDVVASVTMVGVLGEDDH